jgi:hypothetical protein
VIEEWFDAEPVSGHEQLPRSQIQEHDRPHSFQPGKHLVAPLVIGGKDHFGIAFGAKGMAESLQFPAKFAKVVNLPLNSNRIKPSLDAMGCAAASLLSCICSHRNARPARRRGTAAASRTLAPKNASGHPRGKTLAIRPTVMNRRVHGSSASNSPSPGRSTIALRPHIRAPVSRPEHSYAGDLRAIASSKTQLRQVQPEYIQRQNTRM